VIVVHAVPIRAVGEGARRRVSMCQLSGADDAWLALRVHQVLVLDEAVDVANVKLETVNYLSMSMRFSEPPQRPSILSERRVSMRYISSNIM
jgi:hypothetical protein